VWNAEVDEQMHTANNAAHQAAAALINATQTAENTIINISIISS